MAAALTIPEQSKVRDNFSCTGAGFQASHAYTATIYFPNRSSVTLKGTTSGGAFDLSDLADIPLHEPGVVTVSVDDGTDVVEGSTQVFT